MRRLAAEPVVKVRGLLESVQALLLDASGLLYNALTWMMRHALVEVFTILTSDYANSDVSLWSSGFMPDQNHQGFITKKLTHCVRCPPEVQSILQMIEKDMTVLLENLLFSSPHCVVSSAFWNFSRGRSSGLVYTPRFVLSLLSAYSPRKVSLTMGVVCKTCQTILQDVSNLCTVCPGSSKLPLPM